MQDDLTLSDADIETIAAHFTGKRREAFLESIEVVRESLALGGWVSRGRARAGKGFGKGVASAKSMHRPALRFDDPRGDALFGCYMAAAHGSRLRQEHLDVITDADLAALAPKVPVHTMRAWLRLMVALRSICADLDASRPLPVYTEIGLSRKVTATLQDADLDLDLTTRRLCPLDWRWGPAFDRHGKVITRSDGTVVQTKYYFPKWPSGTVFGASRFAHCDCEACGKTIPSGLVVPILVSDRAGRTLGFWFGRDCARNILGIKDAGLEDPRSE